MESWFLSHRPNPARRPDPESFLKHPGAEQEASNGAAKQKRGCLELTCGSGQMLTSDGLFDQDRLDAADAVAIPAAQKSRID
jgi:hypothetical protein